MSDSSDCDPWYAQRIYRVVSETPTMYIAEHHVANSNRTFLEHFPKSRSLLLSGADGNPQTASHGDPPLHNRTTRSFERSDFNTRQEIEQYEALNRDSDIITTYLDKKEH